MSKKKIYPYILVFLQFSCLIYLFTTAPVFSPGYGGIFVEGLGIFLGTYAVLTMRPGNFSIAPILKQNGVLVTSGPYALIRHPMYLAQLIVLLPLVIDYFDVKRLMVFILLVVVLLLKVNLEEKQLSVHFDDYKDYMRKTKKLIPFIY